MGSLVKGGGEWCHWAPTGRVKSGPNTMWRDLATASSLRADTTDVTYLPLLSWPLIVPTDQSTVCYKVTVQGLSTQYRVIIVGFLAFYTVNVLIQNGKFSN